MPSTNRNKNTKKETLKSEQIYALGYYLHDEWRASRKQKGGSFEPRVKKTKDKNWIKINNTEEVDIANTNYGYLPEDWKRENKISAEVTLDEIYLHKDKNQELNEEFIEKASATLHEKWLDRNSQWAAAEQELPYNELSEEEKEKDRVIIRKGLEIFNQKK